MATAQTQDEDLIILSDSIPTTFDETPIIEATPQTDSNNSIISFDWSDILWLNSKQETTELPAQTQEENKDEFNNTLIFSDDLFSWVTESKTEQENNTININNAENTSIWDIFWQNLDQIEEIKEVTPILEDVWPITIQDTTNELLDLTQNNEEIVNANISNEEAIDNIHDLQIEDKTSDSLIEAPIDVEQNNVANMSDLQVESKDSLWDMDDILTTAVDRMKTRQTVINSEKTKKLINVQEKENTIEKLKAEVSFLKAEINDLDIENEKINLNILNLEDMKLWKALQIQKTRTHNTKKVTQNP